MDTPVWGYVLALFVLTVVLAYYVYLGWKIDCLNGTRVKLWNFNLWNSQNSCFQPAVELLHRVMEISMLHGPDIWHTVDLEWGALLNEIEAYLTEIEAEERDALRK